VKGTTVTVLCAIWQKIKCLQFSDTQTGSDVKRKVYILTELIPNFSAFLHVGVFSVFSVVCIYRHQKSINQTHKYVCQNYKAISE